MLWKKLASAAAAVSLIVSAPAVSQTVPRESAQIEDESELRGGILIPALVIIAIAVLVYVLVIDDDDEDPESP